MSKSQPTFEDTSVLEEKVNSITHGIGIVVALSAIVLLAIEGVESNNLLYTVALMIYGLSFLWTYTTSTLYHSFYRSSVKFRNKLHLLDHTAIYLFIAGTYTPISLFVLPGWWSYGILAAVWTIALVGVFFKVFFLGRFKKLSLVLYLLMGWLIVIAAKPMLEHGSHELLFWILAGGICYSIGTIFFSWRNLRFSHGIWHLFVLAGSICHFVGIYIHVPA